MERIVLRGNAQYSGVSGVLKGKCEGILGAVNVIRGGGVSSIDRGLHTFVSIIATVLENSQHLAHHFQELR